MGFPAWRLVVQTPAEILLDAPDVDWVEVPLVDRGPLRLLRGHAELIAETASGPLRYGGAFGEHALQLEGGVLQVLRGHITLFTVAGRALADVHRDEVEGI